MPLLTKPSSDARTAVVYITAGALVDVWTIVWFIYIKNNPPQSGIPYYLCPGLFFTGLTFLVIGAFLGRIARQARQAELAPGEFAADEANIEQTAAEHAPLMSSVNPVPVVSVGQTAVPHARALDAGGTTAIVFNSGRGVIDTRA